jgi:DNA-binding transcriptional ArsR family regulator
MKKKNIDAFAAIADPHRRRIIRMLTKGELTINSLSEKFKISRPAISRHIKVLAENKLIDISVQGRERYCSLNPKGLKEIFDWIQFYEIFWQEKMANLESTLKQKNKNI